MTAPLPHPPAAGDAIGGDAPESTAETATGTPAAPPLGLEIVTTAGGIAARAEALEACVAATGADVYFTPGWLAAWLATQGRHGRPCLILGLAGGRIAAALPCLIETLWLGPIPVRVARLAGSDPSYPVMGLPLPADPAQAAAFLTAAFRSLAEGARIHALSLSPLSARVEGRAGGMEAIRAAAAGAGFAMAREDWSRVHTVMDLPESFEAWLDGLSKSRRREYRKDRAALEARGALATRTTTPETVAERLEAFADLHARQWQAIGKAGHFADWPEALPFARAAVPRLAPSGRARIDEHWCGDTLLSAQYGFRQGTRAYWRLIARTLDPDLVRLGVGRVGLVERVRDLIAEGVRTVEAGAGDYDYKAAYGGEQVAVGRVVLAAPGAGWRVRALLKAADLFDLLYYRGWFLKLRPRLGLKPRPLWRAWRRTRL